MQVLQGGDVAVSRTVVCARYRVVVILERDSLPLDRPPALIHECRPLALLAIVWSSTDVDRPNLRGLRLKRQQQRSSATTATATKPHA